MLKTHSILFITQLLHNRVPCGHNNERNAWAADNLAPLDMPFLSIIDNKPNKSQNHTRTLFITCLLQKWNFAFTLRKTGPAKTGAAGPIPPALFSTYAPRYGWS